MTTVDISPYTGWTRTEWAAYADRLLLGVRPYASPSGALITLPGVPGGYGTAIDGLEGFARTFLMAGFRLAGEQGADPLGLAEWYARGLAAGTDPASPERWTTPREHGQAKVEAASIALILDLTRPWLWDRLDATVQEQVIAYLSQVVGDHDYPQTNWVWFRIVVEQFLASVDAPWSLEDVEHDLAVHESFARDGGWYCDGGERSYDHYAGWALHLYPILWSRMAGAQTLAAPRLPEYKARLDRFLLDAVRLVGADGSPLLQGRSLVYRFAAAAPFWVGAIAETTAVGPGLLRRAASGVVGHFAAHGVPDADDLLTLGWHHPWRRMAQRYSGTGSPYWAAKGLLGLSLPADHPVWTAVEEPLPVEQADQLAVVAAPGWALSATRADGVVRVYNHGTDHAREGDRTGDSPLYARLGYSTATAPLMDDTGWDEPLDQSVVLLDPAGRATHRSGFRTLVTEQVGDAAILASTARAHWLDPDRTTPHHGSGQRGVAQDAADLTTVSIVRGAWEVRLAYADAVTESAVALRIGGWPVTGALPSDVPGTAAACASPRLRSVVAALAGALAGHGVTTARDATPLGEGTAVPWLVARPVPVRTWVAAAIGLLGADVDSSAPTVSVPLATPTAQTAPAEPAAPTARIDGATVTVTWPDGATTTAALPTPATAGPQGGKENAPHNPLDRESGSPPRAPGTPAPPASPAAEGDRPVGRNVP